MSEKKTKSVGHSMGYILGATLCACATVSIIALTIKLLAWVF